MNNPIRRARDGALRRLDALYARMARNRAEAARLLLQEARAVRDAQQRARR